VIGNGCIRPLWNGRFREHTAIITEPNVLTTTQATTYGRRWNDGVVTTAQISVNYPFYDTNVNKQIDIRTFLDKADAAASANRIIFAYKIDSVGTITKLDQRWKP